jgi:hypothetical protein
MEAYDRAERRRRLAEFEADLQRQRHEHWRGEYARVEQIYRQSGRKVPMRQLPAHLRVDPPEVRATKAETPILSSVPVRRSHPPPWTVRIDYAGGYDFVQVASEAEGRALARRLTAEGRSCEVFQMGRASRGGTRTSAGHLDGSAGLMR